MYKKFLIVIVTLIFFRINAQTNTDSTTIYFSQKKYDKTLNYCAKKGDYLSLYRLGSDLFQAKDYNNSLPFFLKTLQIGQISLNEKSNYNLLNVIGHNYQNIDDNDNALKFYNSAFLLNKKINGELHESNIKDLFNLIAVFDLSKKYNESAECYLKILKIREQTKGINSIDYTRTLYNIGWCYIDQKRYDDAEQYFIKAIEIDSKIMNLNSIDYLKSLNNLYIFYGFNKINYEKAEYYLNEIIKIKKNNFGIDNNDYLDSYEMLGFLYENQKKYNDALKIFNEVLEKRKKNKNKNYVITYQSLVRIYCEINDSNQFDYVENISRKYLEETEAILGKYDQNYITGLNYLASFYEHNDILHLAEKKYEEIIDLEKEIFIDNINLRFQSYESLANIYAKEGNYQLAESVHQFVLNKKIENNDPKDELARSYNNLACMYMDEYKYDLALPNFLLAIKMIKDNYSEERTDYGKYLNNLGLLYIKTNKFKEAENYLLKSLQIQEKLNGKYSQDYLMSCSNLAALYQKIDRCLDAEKYYLISINNCLNKNSNDFKNRFLSLSTVYNCLNDLDNEKKYLNISSDYFIKDVISINSYFSSSQRELMMHDIINSKRFPLSFLIRNPNQNDIVDLAFDEELLLKNLTIHNHNKFKNTIIRSTNNELKLKYLKYLENKKKLEKLNEFQNDTDSNDYSNLILETENIEKYLVQNSKEFSKSINTLLLKWKYIQEKLKLKESIIDIIDFTYFDRNKSPESNSYAVFILKKDSKFPKFISLFEEKQLDFLLSRNKIQQDSTRINKQYSDKDISDLFLKPLEKELEGVTTIYLSPSGLGNQIDFSALPINDNQTFGEKYKLHIFSSPAEFMDYKVASLDKKSKIELLLYGGIDYTKSNGNSSLNVDDNSISLNEDFINLAKRSGFEKLPGTLKEVDGINSNASKSGFNSKIYKESDATEESIKALDGRTTPYVLHIATHGYFFPDPVEEISKDILSSVGKSKIYKASDDPMIRSGLLLAGAKNYWGKSNPNNTIEDGILTASEISNLDLRACQLVVLSACETGLGEVKGSEGVFGLQRAFKMAGVKNIIMSLWKVPDTQTAELFDIFYSECFAGKTIHEAFQSAQYQMKAKYSPYYWAGFVLLE